MVLSIPGTPSRLRVAACRKSAQLRWIPESAVSLTATQRRDLMQIVEERYGRRSTVITSQLPLETWHEVIGEPTFADAILDRLVHNAYRIALDGPSLRKTGAENGRDSRPEAAK